MRTIEMGASVNTVSHTVSHDEESDFLSMARAQAAEPTTFTTGCLVQAPPRAVFAIIKEFDLASLAGQISDVKSGSLGERADWAFYTSQLPFPFKARDFLIERRWGKDADGTVWLQSHDLSAKWQRNPLVQALLRPTGHVKGRVLKSDYRLQPRASGSATMVLRTIQIDLALPLPARLLTAMLRAHYWQDFTRLRADLQRVAHPLVQARMQGSAFYASI